MNIGQVNTEIVQIEKLLKKVGLFSSRNYSPSTIEDISIIRHAKYIDIWKYYIGNLIYDIMLTDNSILSFSFTNNSKFSFIYIECPLNCLTFKEFIINQGFYAENTDNSEAKYFFYEDYEFYIESCDVKETFNMIRYDYSPQDYNEGLHPASHFHIGFNTETRLGLKKIVSPITFCYFLLRQVYPNHYLNHLKAEGVNGTSIIIKEILEDLSIDYWKEIDEKEFYLN